MGEGRFSINLGGCQEEAVLPRPSLGMSPAEDEAGIRAKLWRTHSGFACVSWMVATDQYQNCSEEDSGKWELFASQLTSAHSFSLSLEVWEKSSKNQPGPGQHLFGK